MSPIKSGERLESPLTMMITQWWKQSAGTTRVKWMDGKFLSFWVLIWQKWMSSNLMIALILITKDYWSHSFIRITIMLFLIFFVLFVQVVAFAHWIGFRVVVVLFLGHRAVLIATRCRERRKLERRWTVRAESADASGCAAAVRWSWRNGNRK